MLIIETCLQPTPEKGIGLFAKNKIPKGTTWWVRNLLFDNLYSDIMLASLTDIQIGFIRKYGFLELNGKWYLCTDNARFCNHSEKPNTANVWNEKGELISCYASKDILENEEILCDYKEVCLACSKDLGFECKG